MAQSNLNSYIGSVLANSTWTGTKEVINNSISIVCFLNTTVDLTINVYQSVDNKTFYNTDTYLASVSTYGTQTRTQFYTKGQWGYITLTNSTLVDSNSVVLRTLYTPNNHDGTLQQPSYVILENNLPIVVSGVVEVSKIDQALPSGTNALGSVSVSNLPSQPLVFGENSNFVFYPSIENNTISVYADGIAGVNVAGGWQYANTPAGKINWYCYSSATPETDYKVSQLTSMYTIINQQSTLGLSLAENPFIIIYTRPTSTATTWYQNKLFFGSNAGTDTTGIKLLYTGNDPTDIHPEIIGVNRIKLDFNLSLSTATLALAQNDSIFLGSLQTTNNTTTPNSFSFTMQEFGAEWKKTPSILPIEFNKLQISGTVNMLNATNLSYFNYATITGSSFALNFVDIQQYSTCDIYLKADSVVSVGGMQFDIQYSPDGTNWFSSSTTLTLTTIQPQAINIGNVNATSYIRLYYSTLTPLDVATNVKYWINAKSL